MKDSSIAELPEVEGSGKPETKEDSVDEESRLGIRGTEEVARRAKEVTWEELREHVARWADQKINETYRAVTGDQLVPAGAKRVDSFDLQHEVEEEIARLVGESGSYAEGRYAGPYRAAVRIFLERLVEFVEEKSDDPREQEELPQFISLIHESFFSHSPTFANQVGMAEQLVLTAKANRIPEAQGWFGQAMVGEVVYELNFCDGKTVDILADSIAELPISEQLDVIHQLQTVGGDAAGQGDWADNGLRRVYAVLEQIQERSDSPLVTYATQLALERVGEENVAPQLGPWTWHGNRSGGRLGKEATVGMFQNHQRLAGQVNPDRRVEGMLLPVAPDAVGIFDHSHLPRFLGKIRLNELKEPVPVSIVAVRNARETLARNDLRLDGLMQTLNFVEERILARDESISPDAALREALRVRIREALGPPRQDPNVVYRRIRSNPPAPAELAGLREDAERYLESIERVLAERLPPVHFEPYREIPQDGELNPFHAGADEALPLLLQHLHEPELRGKIEQDLGVSLVSVPIRSQVHLLRFLAGADRAGFDRLRAALNRQKESASDLLLSFLACAEDKKYGDAILTLAEKLEPRTARAVFTKYAEIEAESARVGEYLRTAFGAKREYTEEQCNKIVKSLLHRGNELLARYAVRAVAQEGAQAVSPERITMELEKVKTNILLFAASFKVASETDSVELGDVQGTELRTLSSELLTREEKEEMKRIFEENRPGYSPALLKKTLGEFQEALESKDKKFYILTNEGAVVAFIRFDELPDGNLYAGSLNVRPEVRGSAIGSAMLVATLDKEGESRTIEAVAYSKNPMLKHYTGEFGFRIVGELADYEGTGELFYKLEREPRAKLAEAA